MRLGDRRGASKSHGNLSGSNADSIILAAFRPRSASSRFRVAMLDSARVFKSSALTGGPPRYLAARVKLGLFARAVPLGKSSKSSVATNRASTAVTFFLKASRYCVPPSVVLSFMKSAMASRRCASRAASDQVGGTANRPERAISSLFRQLVPAAPPVHGARIFPDRHDMFFHRHERRPVRCSDNSPVRRVALYRVVGSDRSRGR